MKRTLLILAVLGTLVACKKKATTEETASSSNKLTISGKAYAELDITNANTETAVSGTKVTAFVLLTDLKSSYNPNSSDTLMLGKYASFSGTIGGNGIYSIDIPCPIKQIPFRVVFDEFAYDKITGTTTSQRTVYSTPDIISTEFGGTSVVYDVMYN